MTAVDEFQYQTEALAAATQQEVIGIYTQLAAGVIAREAAVLMVASVINKGQRRRGVARRLVPGLADRGAARRAGADRPHRPD